LRADEILDCQLRFKSMDVFVAEFCVLRSKGVSPVVELDWLRWSAGDRAV